MGRLSDARDKRDRAREGVRKWQKIIRERREAGHKAAAGRARERLDELRRKLERVVRRIGKIIRRRRFVRWPKDIFLAELLYHDPPHLHVASPERDKLIQLARIGQRKYSLRIGEFPPVDPVEDVHISGTWHYRDSSDPWRARSFSERGNGLAFDANDADGGSDGEVAFYTELKRRYW